MNPADQLRDACGVTSRAGSAASRLVENCFAVVEQGSLCVAIGCTTLNAIDDQVSVATRGCILHLDLRCSRRCRTAS